MVSSSPSDRPARRPGIVTGLRIQARVLSGLMMRELAARFGRRGTGMVFTFVVPMAQSGMLAFVRSLGGLPAYGGLPMMPFIVCGLIPFRGWRNMANSQLGAVQGNTGLLYYYHVTGLDIHLAGFLVGLSINLTVAGVIYSVMRIFGLSPEAYQPFYLVLLLILANLFGFGWGLLLAGISYYIPVVRSINLMAMRVLYFTSGVFFALPEVPPQLRVYFLWNPLLHITELARTYYFRQYDPGYGNLNYVLIWVVGCFFVGLLLERLHRNDIRR